MRVVLADLKGTRGFVSKDTVAAGYGSRLTPFSRTAWWVCTLKGRMHSPPSVQMAQLAAMAAEQGHEVSWTRADTPIDGDVALILSSLVDYKHETAWADMMRQRGVRVGFVGLTASKMPEIFVDHADFILNGEPEEAARRLFGGQVLSGIENSPQLNDLDSLPFPRWDLIGQPADRGRKRGRTVRPLQGGFPVMASRGCPEFCTYCPHRILAGHRSRSVDNIVDELAEICERYNNPYIIFRDPLFTDNRDRAMAISEQILSRGLKVRFECETRLDRLDETLLRHLHRAGLRAMSFGVESLDPDTLKKAGRRPIPPAHQRAMINFAHEIGIITAAFYVFGFLQDTWASIAQTIDYSIEIGSRFAQFKILTPYPGTPLWKQMKPLVFEQDWEKFDGFTPTFNHPNLTPTELRFLLGAAFSRFYVRPTFLANQLGIQSAPIRKLFAAWDTKVIAQQARREIAEVSRAVSC
jgi:anaerobic magnesium-protoporphyrin IX monomethyl ester cyclase